MSNQTVDLTQCAKTFKDAIEKLYKVHREIPNDATLLQMLVLLQNIEYHEHHIVLLFDDWMRTVKKYETYIKDDNDKQVFATLCEIMNQLMQTREVIPVNVTKQQLATHINQKGEIVRNLASFFLQFMQFFQTVQSLIGKIDGKKNMNLGEIRRIIYAALRQIDGEYEEITRTLWTTIRNDVCKGVVNKLKVNPEIIVEIIKANSLAGKGVDSIALQIANELSGSTADANHILSSMKETSNMLSNVRYFDWVAPSVKVLESVSAVENEPLNYLFYKTKEDNIDSRLDEIEKNNSYINDLINMAPMKKTEQLAQKWREHNLQHKIDLNDQEVDEDLEELRKIAPHNATYEDKETGTIHIQKKRNNHYNK